MKEDREKEKLRAALVKCALGYITKEENEEYALVDGDMLLTKRKISLKEVPPQLRAIEILMGEGDSFASMSEEELHKEKIRLIKLLLETETETKRKKIRKESKENGID